MDGVELGVARDADHGDLLLHHESFVNMSFRSKEVSALGGDRGAVDAMDSLRKTTTSSRWEPEALTTSQTTKVCVFVVTKKRQSERRPDGRGVPITNLNGENTSLQPSKH